MTVTEKIKQHLRITGFVLENSFEKRKTFRDAVYAMRSEGWELKRVCENNKVIGYQLVGRNDD